MVKKREKLHCFKVLKLGQYNLNFRPIQPDFTLCYCLFKQDKEKYVLKDKQGTPQDLIVCRTTLGNNKSE